MPGYLLDTNTVRNWFDGESGRFPNVQRAAEARAAKSPLYVSSITLGEMEFGHATNPAGAGEVRDNYLRFIKHRLPQILAVSKHTAEPYGVVRAKILQSFPPCSGWSKKKRSEQLYDPLAGRELGIDENDLWLVAQSVERNLVLVTSDKMFRIREAVHEMYPGFVIENWASSDAGSVEQDPS